MAPSVRHHVTTEIWHLLYEIWIDLDNYFSVWNLSAIWSKSDPGAWLAQGSGISRVRARRAPVVEYAAGRLAHGLAELYELVTGWREQVDTEMDCKGRCLALPCSTTCAFLKRR